MPPPPPPQLHAQQRALFWKRKGAGGDRRRVISLGVFNSLWGVDYLTDFFFSTLRCVIGLVEYRDSKAFSFIIYFFFLLIIRREAFDGWMRWRRLLIGTFFSPEALYFWKGVLWRWWMYFRKNKFSLENQIVRLACFGGAERPQWTRIFLDLTWTDFYVLIKTVKARAFR